MLRNYIKIALRNLLRYKLYAVVNILGLAAGMAAAILILLYARNELNYDTFHENADRIYYVYKERQTGTGTRMVYDTWVPLLGELQHDFPGISGGARLLNRERWVQSGDKKFREPVTFADPSLLTIFTFPLARGQAAMPQDRSAAVISQEIARKYFGEADPIGQTLRIDYSRDYVVSGVLAPYPANSTLAPQIIVPLASVIDPDNEEASNNWGSSFLDTYVLLSPGASATELEAQFPQLVHKIWGEDGPNGTRNHKLRLLPLHEMHNQFTGSNRYAYILIGIAIAILLIGAINFVNLATARSLDRAREIGMRKVIGAGRAQLIGQFLGEALVISLLALALGTLVAVALLPAFNEVLGLNLQLDLISGSATLPGLLAVGLLVGLLAGLYPALVLSGFRPIEALKGGLQQAHGGMRLRSALVVVQFVLSIALMMGTAAVWQQIEFMQSQDLRFDEQRIVVIPTNLADFENQEQATAQMRVIRQELEQQTGFESVAASSAIPGDYPNWNTFARPFDWQQDEPLRMRLAFVDDRYFELYGIEFVEGRNFSAAITSDRESGLIMNEAAMRAMGWQTATGKQVYRGDTPFTVVGVVRDFHWQSLQNEIAPVLHFYRPPENGVHNYVSVKLGSGSTTELLATLKAKWQKLDPQRDFDYAFVDDNFARQYRAEQNIGTLTNWLSSLAILLACMGLFALASFTVVRRTHEIGIRKTLGASTGNIMLLLGRSFFALVAIAVAIAWPLAHYLVQRWLENFAYRLTPGIEVFAGASLVAFVITLITISYHCMRAALTNPAEVLRSE